MLQFTFSLPGNESIMKSSLRYSLHIVKPHLYRNFQLHVPSHDHDHAEEGTTGQASPSSRIDVKTKARITKRSAEEKFRDRYNETLSPESLRLRKVVHVVGPDDLPELQGASLYGKFRAP